MTRLLALAISGEVRPFLHSHVAPSENSNRCGTPVNQYSTRNSSAEQVEPGAGCDGPKLPIKKLGGWSIMKEISSSSSSAGRNGPPKSSFGETLRRSGKRVVFFAAIFGHQQTAATRRRRQPDVCRSS